jgi:hypothetical protein
MTLQYAKTIRKKLRELACLAHERELSRAMENACMGSCLDGLLRYEFFNGIFSL